MRKTHTADNHTIIARCQQKSQCFSSKKLRKSKGFRPMRRPDPPARRKHARGPAAKATGRSGRRKRAFPTSSDNRGAKPPQPVRESISQHGRVDAKPLPFAAEHSLRASLPLAVPVLRRPRQVREHRAHRPARADENRELQPPPHMALDCGSSSRIASSAFIGAVPPVRSPGRSQARPATRLPRGKAYPPVRAAGPCPCPEARYEWPRR